jgi:N-hydroxyarylamine O-acetyltransferase
VNVDAALDRLRYTGSRAPTAETLRSLHRAFLEAVPFENLDICAGVPISLDPARIYEKIVVRRRGGFCYECNGLFADLLAALGYTILRLSARMALDGEISEVEGVTYRVGHCGEDYALYYREAGSEWLPRFLFSRTPRAQADFSEMCEVHQTAPDSIFTRRRLATIATRDGRITLTGNRLIETRGAERRERDLRSDAEIVACLRTHFGIELPNA